MDFPNLPPDAPAHPVPAQGVSNVEQTVRLSWAACTDPEGGEVTYAIQVGITPDRLEPGPSTKQTNAKLVLPDRGPTVYFWRVFASDPEGNTTVGPLWSFKTAGVSPPGNAATAPLDVPSGVDVTP